jgi:hypothetical protein
MIVFPAVGDVGFAVMFDHHARILTRQTGAKADLQKIPIGPPLVGRIHEKNIGGKAFPLQKAECGENVRVQEPKVTLYAAQLQILPD